MCLLTCLSHSLILHTHISALYSTHSDIIFGYINMPTLSLSLSLYIYTERERERDRERETHKERERERERWERERENEKAGSKLE